MERRRPLPQELVDEGGLPGVIAAGEEGGGGRNLGSSKDPTL